MSKFLLSLLLLITLSGCVENKIDRQIRCPNCNGTYHISLTAGYDNPIEDLYGIEKLCITHRCNCGKIYTYTVIEKTINIVKSEEE